jgi:hypothetical protein
MALNSIGSGSTRCGISYAKKSYGIFLSASLGCRDDGRPGSHSYLGNLRMFGFSCAHLRILNLGRSMKVVFGFVNGGKNYNHELHRREIFLAYDRVPRFGDP